MSTMAWYAFEAAIAIFEVLVYFDFYNHFFTRNNAKKRYIALFVLLCCSNSFMSIRFNVPLVLLLNFFAMNSLIVFLLFDGNFLHKLFSAVLLVALGLLSEVLSGLLISIMGVVDITTIMDLNVYRITGIAVSKVVFFLIVKIIERFRKAKAGEITIQNWLMLMLIPIISILIIHQIAFSMTPTRATLPLITIAGIMYINTLVFALFEALMRQAQREVRYKLMEQQFDSQMNYYKSLSSSRNEIRKIWHDLKNHLLCLHSMASEGDLAGIMEYIGGMNILAAQAIKTIDTGNPAIDAVLNEKRVAAERESISIDLEVLVTPNVKIDPIDACILLGNSLDNAIEACAKVEGKQRRITVKFIQRDGHLLLTVINSANGVYIYENHAYTSTKDDHRRHGFGLLNIQAIVSKYGGNLMLSHDEESFTLNAILQEGR